MELQKSSTSTLLRDYKSLGKIPQDADLFLNLVEKFGIKQLCKLPDSILEDEKLVKKLINLDPYSLYYLPDNYHQDKYFKEVTKKHEILLLNPINKKLQPSTINWIIDNCPDYVRFEFLKKPFPQLDESNILLREKIGIGFLIKGIKVPKYLENDIEKYKDLRVDELILIKETIFSYEKIEESLNAAQKSIKKDSAKIKI